MTKKVYNNVSQADLTFDELILYFKEIKKNVSELEINECDDINFFDYEEATNYLKSLK